MEGGVVERGNCCQTVDGGLDFSVEMGVGCWEGSDGTRVGCGAVVVMRKVDVGVCRRTGEGEEGAGMNVRRG